MKVAYLPGMDHAGIATQVRFEKDLREAGINPEELAINDYLNRINL
jgi:valyl-tRNA synthetase